jgi:Ca-activated chloride channel family protein
MEFANPKWLNALYVIPFLVVVLGFGARQRRRETEAFAGSLLRDRLAPGSSWRKTLLKSVLVIAGFACLVTALARPQFGGQLVKVEREGIDVVIALDTSLSMLAEDMKPNRLERAKIEIVDLIRGLKGDRVGLVAFAGDAFVLCPLTVDYDAALMFAQTADFDMVSSQGSALQKAIETSAAMFQEGRKNDRVIILVTDGESHEGDPVGAARAAAEKGIRVYTIGIGNSAGELIPLRGTDGSITGYKKDSDGQTVLTRLDAKTLRAVADAAHGKYMPATREGLELKVLYREISGLEKAKIEGEFVERKQDRFGWFLGASLLLLGFDAVVTRKGSMKGRRSRVLHTGAAAAVFFIAILLTPVAILAKSVDRGRVNAGNQYFDSHEYEKALALYREALRDSTRQDKLASGVRYNEANALHMMNRYEDALKAYGQSVSDDSLQTSHGLYNRGNTLLKLGKIDDAIESYLQSLQYSPDDADARYNLELALRQRKQQQKQKQKQQQQKDQKNDEQKQDSQDDKSQSQQGKNNSSQDQQQDQKQKRNDQNTPQEPDSTQMAKQSPADSTQGQPKSSNASIQLTQEDALRILKLLEEQEKELQKEKRKAAFKRVSRNGKDW